MTAMPSVPLSLYIVVKDGAAAIEFYKDAFGAKELFRLTEPSGKIGHAELDFNGGLLMLAEEYPDFGALSPATIGGSPVSLYLAVANTDEAVERTIKAGATLTRPAKDEFYGERTAQVTDPFGYRWSLNQRIEEVSAAEMQRRWDEMLKG